VEHCWIEPAKIACGCRGGFGQALNWSRWPGRPETRTVVQRLEAVQAELVAERDARHEAEDAVAGRWRAVRWPRGTFRDIVAANQPEEPSQAPLGKASVRKRPGPDVGLWPQCKSTPNRTRRLRDQSGGRRRWQERRQPRLAVEGRQMSAPKTRSSSNGGNRAGRTDFAGQTSIDSHSTTRPKCLSSRCNFCLRGLCYSSTCGQRPAIPTTIK
jgi:hypothetical protein